MAAVEVAGAPPQLIRRPHCLSRPCLVMTINRATRDTSDMSGQTIDRKWLTMKSVVSSSIAIEGNTGTTAAMVVTCECEGDGVSFPGDVKGIEERETHHSPRSSSDV